MMLSAAHFSDRIPTNFVDCEDAPYDLRPVVEAVMAAENWLLSRLPPDQKIVFLLNESHTDQMHGLFQEAILKAHTVQKRKNPVLNFGFGLEIMHTHKAKNGVPVMEGMMITGEEANRHLIAFALRKKISVRFNDAAMASMPELFEIPTLDVTDKLTRDMMVKRTGFASPFFSSVEQDGLAIRNDVIVHNAIKHMEHIGARIYLQQCGAGHSFGARQSPYEDSLYLKFKEKGCAVVPVFPQRFDIDPHHLRWNVPPTAIMDSILVSGMAISEFYEESYATARALVVAASGPNIF